MDRNASNLDTDQLTGNGGAPVSLGDGVQQTEAPGVGLDHVGPDQEPAARSRRSGPRPLLFVLVLTAVVMVFAIIVAVWMYWLAPALAV